MAIIGFDPFPHGTVELKLPEFGNPVLATESGNLFGAGRDSHLVGLNTQRT